MVEAWNDEGLGAWDDAMHEEVVWVALPGNPDFPEPIQGKEAVLDVVRQWLEPWGRYEVHTEALWRAGDAVIWTARHSASGHRLGMSVETPMTAVMTFRDDRIGTIRFFASEEDARAALSV